MCGASLQSHQSIGNGASSVIVKMTFNVALYHASECSSALYLSSNVIRKELKHSHKIVDFTWSRNTNSIRNSDLAKKVSKISLMMGPRTRTLVTPTLSTAE